MICNFVHILERGVLPFFLLLAGPVLWAQQEREDTLKAAVFTDRQEANYISGSKPLRTEVISSAGLMKMACCNLAESFENSASVAVDYADATTGARQIRLLGLSGAYTQLLDENRPIPRGLASPYGLSYLPGAWLESIQIAKGSPSVINGIESMTGQINLEHRKPTDEKPLFVNASVMSDTKTDLNVLSSLQLSDKVYTILMGHVDGNFKTHDMNRDGFVDEPALLQFNLANRWLYYTPQLQVRWGVRAIRDTRKGAQMDGPWTSDVANSLLNGYFKIGRSFKEDGSGSIALVGDYSGLRMDALFGANSYDALQHNGFMNLIYRNKLNDSHDFTVGVNGAVDAWTEDIRAGGQSVTGAVTRFWRLSPYAEYTFSAGDRFSLIAGLSGLLFQVHGAGGETPLRAVPRLTFKYQPLPWMTLRANGGRGIRPAHPLADNSGILSTGKAIQGDLVSRPLEDAWTYGGNITFSMGGRASLSLDYFRTHFVRQLLVDREQADRITFYQLDGHPSWSDSYQADFSSEPIDRLTLTLTARYSDARAWQPSGEVREVALSSRFKGVFNAQYKTRLSRWVFDFTASLNGSARVYDFMQELKDEDGNLLYPDGRTPAYPLLYAQVTRRFRGFDLYVGGENLTGYRQKCPIVRADDPFSAGFDAASVWGPLMGAKIYMGLRITIWK